MLPIQSYLINGQDPSILGLKIVRQDDLLILNYSQIDSPRFHPICDDCRGLVLDTDYNLVARSFSRFYNLSERKDIYDWTGACVTEKHDGSLILVYYHNGWRVNTRGSFGDGLINGSSYTWRNLVWSLLDITRLDTSLTYVFELCSPYNRVVRAYPEPKLYLLTAFHGVNELNYPDLPDINVEVTKQYDMKSDRDILNYIDSINDPTFEGFVVRNHLNDRIKVKAESYVRLHKTLNNGNVFLPKNLIPIILENEHHEVISYFPSAKPIIDDLIAKMDNIKKEVDNIWFCHGDEKNQKRFALTILKETKYTHPLFMAKNRGGHPFDFMDSNFWVKYIN